MYKRVLVPLDGSPVAESIISFILDIAGPLDMEVILFRAVEPIPPPAMEAYVDAETVELRSTDAQEYLAAIAAELRSKAVRVDSRVRWGHAADEIVATARETGADLIAMSTHGRSGLGRVIFGSVAQAVLRQAETPVFLMRATESQVAERASRMGGAEKAFGETRAVSAPRRPR
jgi:nucleotide-binding universal stress UspA family protein